MSVLICKASVTRCNFLSNLCRNGIARQVVGRLQRVTGPLGNSSLNYIGLTTIAVIFLKPSQVEA